MPRPFLPCRCTRTVIRTWPSSTPSQLAWPEFSSPRRPGHRQRGTRTTSLSRTSMMPRKWRCANASWLFWSRSSTLLKHGQTGVLGAPNAIGNDGLRDRYGRLISTVKNRRDADAVFREQSRREHDAERRARVSNKFSCDLHWPNVSACCRAENSLCQAFSFPVSVIEHCTDPRAGAGGRQGGGAPKDSPAGCEGVRGTNSQGPGIIRGNTISDCIPMRWAFTTLDPVEAPGFCTHLVSHRRRSAPRQKCIAKWVSPTEGTIPSLTSSPAWGSMRGLGWIMSVVPGACTSLLLLGLFPFPPIAARQ